MTFEREIEAFIKIFVKDLSENNVAIFAGAGMSKEAGYVDWYELLDDIAEEIGLKIKTENDLISLAQYHVNERGGKAGLIKKILEEFSEQAEFSENHKILARLPISTFWTTNYDTLIEDSLKDALKIVDVKHQIKQLVNTRPKRDVVVYKMHGDVHHPADAILTKEQYEFYYRTHEHFIMTLSGDLITKTFLFIGFSFTDPNLDYILSRLNYQFKEDKRQHYCFIKKESKSKDDDEEIFKYKQRKQKLRVDDLKRYGIKALLIDDYCDVTKILSEIENRFRKKTIFISGSAEEYGQWNRNQAQEFIHLLSKKIVSSNYRIVNGFGWGIGSAVINGALEVIYEKPDKASENQLIIKPFPQFESGEKKLPILWEEYRQKMILLAGIAIFVFGNKKDENGNIILANGVKREFEIAIQHGLIPIPIATTGYMAKEIFNEISSDYNKYFLGIEWIIPILEELSSSALNSEEIISKVLTIFQKLNK
jgi:hypothetical protein